MDTLTAMVGKRVTILLLHPERQPIRGKLTEVLGTSGQLQALVVSEGPRGGPPYVVPWSAVAWMREDRGQ